MLFYSLDLSQRQAWFARRSSGIVPFLGTIVSQKMVTSGFSSGVSHKFEWGPDFMVMHEFTSRLFTARSYSVEDWEQAHGATILVKRISISGKTTSIKMMYCDPCCRAYELSTLSLTDVNGFMALLESIKNDVAGGCLILSPSVLEAILLTDDLRMQLIAFLQQNDVQPSSTYEPILDVVVSVLPGIRNHMRCWDSGATFFTCSVGRVHWVDMLAELKVENGCLYACDLWNYAQDAAWRNTGDQCKLEGYELCECGVQRLRGSTPIRHAQSSVVGQVANLFDGRFAIIVDPVVTTFASYRKPDDAVLEEVRKITGSSVVGWQPYIDLYRGKVRPLSIS